MKVISGYGEFRFVWLNSVTRDGRLFTETQIVNDSISTIFFLMNKYHVDFFLTYIRSPYMVDDIISITYQRADNDLVFVNNVCEQEVYTYRGSPPFCFLFSFYKSYQWIIKIGFNYYSQLALFRQCIDLLSRYFKNNDSTQAICDLSTWSS